MPCLSQSPTKSRITRQRPAAPSLPLAFLARAAALPGKALAVAVALCALAHATRSSTVVLGGWARRRFALSADAALDGLTRLEAAGLVRARRGRGRPAEVTILAEPAALVGGRMTSGARR